MPTLPGTSQGHGQTHEWPHTESFKVDSDAASQEVLTAEVGGQVKMKILPGTRGQGRESPGQIRFGLGLQARARPPGLR